MTEPILVVDVGTSGTRVALVVGDQTTLVKEPASGAASWPSSVCLADDGFLVGTPAEVRKRAIPRRYIDGPRRAVDAQASMWLEHREVTGVEALSAYLTVIGAETRQLYGGPVDRLTLTVPAEYLPGDPRRDAMIAIGEATGFRDVELLPATVAIALDPLTDGDLPAGALVLVCDLGATWTTAVVQVYGSHSVQLAQQTCAAGRELDALLINDLRTEGRSWLEPMLAAPGDAGLRAYYEAIDFTRRLKHQLVDTEEVVDHLTPLTPPYRLTRGWLDAFAEPALRWLVDSAQDVLATVGASPADITAVMVAGGGAYLPAVHPTLQAGLGFSGTGGERTDPLRRGPEPELAVLRGAARFAAGAAGRVIVAEPPRWRVEPTTWEVPGGRARLLRWCVPPGEPYPAGAVLAHVRTPDERVFELTAAQHGRQLGQQSAPGDLVGPVLVVASAKDALALQRQPPPRRRHLESTGSWLLSPDRLNLVECDRSARVVRLRAIADDTVLAEFRPDHGTSQDSRGRVFIDPDGRLSVVAWDTEGFVSVWDIETGKLTARFRDPGEPHRLLVDENRWQAAVEGRGRAVGRYRRTVTTLWDLRGGTRVDRITDDNWHQRMPEFAEHSRAEGLATAGTSPDGQLRAGVVAGMDGIAAIVLHDASTGQELFRVLGGTGQRVRVGFSADSRHLLANWESDERSLIDVWDV
ncbi:Hsp70 family protein [Solwaraspora sp. WMMD406]|uniref:Hsp70 family protein n=1 Tax=Solwaraspora sp. WMMD406 TaxID=3016095 RepID=UPI00241668B7|nr:Hsp70 family protein [Solwaraspora sp. WMMD406]MDG4767541.1 Hsp70 family protein [Solwaraspora sp. WMMD406]